MTAYFHGSKKTLTTSNPVKNTHTKTTKVTFVQKRLHLTIFFVNVENCQQLS